MTSIFLPYEFYGARGGKAAYAARLRAGSYIEVEQAALAAAAPGSQAP